MEGAVGGARPRGSAFCCAVAGFLASIVSARARGVASENGIFTGGQRRFRRLALATGPFHPARRSPLAGKVGSPAAAWPVRTRTTSTGQRGQLGGFLIVFVFFAFVFRGAVIFKKGGCRISPALSRFGRSGPRPPAAISEGSSKRSSNSSATGPGGFKRA